MWELIPKGRCPGSPSAPLLDLQSPLDPSPYACGTFVNVATTMRLKCGLNQAGKEGGKAAGKKPNNEYCTSFPTGQKSQV